MPPTETPPMTSPASPAAAPVVPPVPAVSPSATDQAAANAAALAAASAPPPAAPSPPPAAPPAPVEYTLALPTGAVLEASAIERTTAFAKATGLSPAAAQHALNHANAEVAADRAQQKAAQAEAFKTMATKTWVEEIRADATFGGEKYLTTVEEVKRAADRFLTDADRVVLNQTGWGNHPLLVKMFARIGQAMKNDTFVQGGASGGGVKPDAATLLYGDTKKPV